MADVPLYNPNDGITGRDGGPYLDQVEAEQAEVRRAKVEGREPDLDNPPATAGIPLTTAAQMIHNLDVNIPSKSNFLTTGGAAALYRGAEDDENTNLVAADSYNPDEVSRLREEAAESETKAEDFNENDPNAPVDDTGTSSESNSGGQTLGFTADDDVNFDDDDDSKAPAKKTAAKRTSSSK